MKVEDEDLKDNASKEENTPTNAAVTERLSPEFLLYQT